MLRVATEAYVTGLFADSNEVLKNTKRKTVCRKDVQLAKKLRASDGDHLAG